MDERKTLYRMNRLMKYTEIEAFSAQKNAGSKAAYFDLLTEFTRIAPGLAQELLDACALKDLAPFQKKIFELQKMLLGIGASGLLWEAEKTAEAARQDDKVKCADRAAILVAKVRSLCERLNHAKIDPDAVQPDSANSSDTAIVAMAQGAGAPGRPQAAIEPEQFARLRPLVENFETDQALALLTNLMAASYNNHIDSLLAELYDSLTSFNQDGAELHLRRLLEVVREGKGDAGDNAPKKKILAIDDVPDVLNTVKSILKNDYAVYGVTNYKAALKFLTMNSPDLILLDIEMPEMDGFALLGIIRQLKPYENTPAVFLTGSVTVENIIKSRNAGGNDFIKKPIDAQVLLSKIKKHLD